MMYIIYNHDGSIKTLVVDESIQQNNNGVNQIFVSIEGYETTDYTCVANFELPDGTLNSLVGVADVGVEVGELTYDGFVITLTNAQTLYPGKLKMSIKLVDLQDRQLCTYQTELQVNPSSAVPSETFITNAQYNSLIQSLRSYVLYADLVNYADKEWVGDNYLSLDGGEMNGDAHIILSKESESSFVYPYIRIQNANEDVRTTLQYDRIVFTGSDAPNRPEYTIYYNGTIDVGQNTLYLPQENGTLATREWGQKKLYRHLLGFTGDGGYAVGFELINDVSSSMTITGSFDSTTKTLTFSNVSRRFQNLKFVMARGSEQYLYATINYIGTTDQYGTLKIRTYRIQSDGTLSPITTYNTLTDTVEEL